MTHEETIKRIQVKKIIEKGEIMPRGYGLAYIDFARQSFVCYPFPINHLIRIYRDIWYKVRHAKIREWETELEKKHKNDYERGKDEIRLEFFDACANPKAGMKSFEEMIDKWKVQGFYLERYRNKNNFNDQSEETKGFIGGLLN